MGLSAEEKDDIFIIVLSGIPKQKSIFIGSDMNGHVGKDADMGMVMPMVVWDLVQETLKVRGF